MASDALDRDCLSFGDFIIDRADERLIGPGGPVRLGNKAYRVLLMLVDQQGRLLTKDALFSSVWDGTIVSESALTSVIKELRRALCDESRPPRYIESVYGRGYRFLPEVSRSSGRAVPAAESKSAPGAKGARPQGKATPPAKGAKPPLLYVTDFDDSAVRDLQPYLAAALREEILLALSRFRDIRLVSAAGTGAPATEAAGDRDYRLTLKLVPYGDSVRAFVRLVRLGTQAIIWADQVELDMRGLGADIDRLVRTIASAALPRMQDDLLCNLPPQPEDVYDLYFSIRLRMRAMHGFAEAREIASELEEMVRRYPEFVLAYPPLTRLYNTDYCFTGIGSSGEHERRLAYELAHQALALDPTESHLHTVKGWAHLWAGEPLLAEQHLAEALRLNPYNQHRLVELATGFMYLGKLDRAAELLERCRDLTPFATEAPHEEQGLLHLLSGEFEAAASQLALVRRYHPDDRAGTKPTLTSELYALLAAAGLEAPDVSARAEGWRGSMAERWCRPEPLDDDRLIAWVSFHEPLQDPARKQWLVELLERALKGGSRSPRALSRAKPGSASKPSAAEGVRIQPPTSRP